MLRLRTLAVILVVVVAVAAGAFVVWRLLPSSSAGSSGGSVAPNFAVTEISGQNFTLDSYRNQSVVLILFTSTTCSACQIVEKSLKTIQASYARPDQPSLQLISIFTDPQLVDTVHAMKAYQATDNITWGMAQDTMTDSIQHAYGVTEDPTVVIVDKPGRITYDTSGGQSTTQLSNAIASAESGKAAAVSLVTVSVFALAALAGVTTFFSPCAFPMFPGYMGLFLGLNAKGTESSDALGSTYGRATRRAVIAGSATALGMIVVFLALGLALILAANAIGGFIPFFLVLVGGALIVLGALLLTNLQYWRIITPLQNLWARLRGRPANGTVGGGPAPAPGQGLYLKLFGYGMGYAAAASGCVAPVIFSAIVAGLALGFYDGILNILIFGLTAAVLMIVVTVLLALAGKRFVSRLSALTPIIKKVSAVVLVIVGIYLIYYYYTAWGFSHLSF